MLNMIILIALAVFVIGATYFFFVFEKQGDLGKQRILGSFNFVAIVLLVSRLVDFLRAQYPGLDQWCKENTIYEMVVLMGIYVLAAWFFLSPLATNSPDSRYYDPRKNDINRDRNGEGTGGGQPMNAQQKRRRNNQWKEQQRKKKHREKTHRHRSPAHSERVCGIFPFLGKSKKSGAAGEAEFCFPAAPVFCPAG